MQREIDAIVLEGASHPALAIVRNLGEHGLRVAVGADTPVACARASKFCKGFFLYPSPYEQPEQAVLALADYIRHTPGAVLIPYSDVWHASIHKYSDYFSDLDVQMAMPDPILFDCAANKADTIQRALRLGVPVPETYFPESVESVKELLPTLRFPLVVKSRRSLVFRKDRFHLTQPVAYVSNPEELLDSYQRMFQDEEPPLLQSWVPGRGMGVFLLCNRGETLVRFAHKRIRDVNPTGSASAVRESLAFPEDMGRDAQKLAKDLKWHGPMMVEFRYDQASDTHHLMEINGRLWGSLQLGIDAGQEFPFALYELYRGRPTAWPEQYPIGIRSRWLNGDFIGLMRTLKGPPPGYTGSFPGRKQAIKDFVFSSEQTRLELLRLYDPKPYFYEVMWYLRRSLKQLKP